MSEENPTPKVDTESEAFKEAVSAEVEKIAAKIKSEERRKASEKFADYDELRAKAGTATTLEERVAEIEKAASAAARRAEVAEVANAKGLTPNQAKRLVGATREELEADADELIKDIGAQKQKNNVSPREGNNPKATDDPMRDFARGLFARATSE